MTPNVDGNGVDACAKRTTSSSPLWMGLDLSTQSLKVVLLHDSAAAPLYLDSIDYSEALPQYQTEHGMHISDGDDGEKVSATKSSRNMIRVDVLLMLPTVLLTVSVCCYVLHLLLRSSRERFLLGISFQLTSFTYIAICTKAIVRSSLVQ